MIRTTEIPATQLAVGDIVWTYGYRVRLDVANPTYTPGLVSFTGPVINADELDRSIRVSVWTVQGNAHRSVTVEEHAAGCDLIVYRDDVHTCDCEAAR
jgi:hypothetical protein